MKKFLSVMFLILVITCISTSICFAKEFPDVPSDHWAHEYISKLSDDGVINGYEDGTFNPSGTITRAEFYKLMACTEYSDTIFQRAKEEYNYTDWYQVYMIFTMEAGYFTDDIGYGNPNDPITRKEMIISLGKYIYDKLKQMGELDEIKFDDLKNAGINAYELNCVKLACSKNLINGYEDGSFKPNNNMTRAEASAILYRYSKMMEEIR